MSTTPEFTTVGTFVHDSLSLVTCVAGSCFRAREEISRTRGRNKIITGTSYEGYLVFDHLRVCDYPSRTLNSVKSVVAGNLP